MPAPTVRQRRILRMIREGATSTATAAGPREVTGSGAIVAPAPAVVGIPPVFGSGAISAPAARVDGIDVMEAIRQDMATRIDAIVGTTTNLAPGVAYGLYTPDHGQFSAGSGVKEIGGAAVDGDTLFCLGSVTKTLTAYAFAKAKVDGDLGWNTLANTWLDSSPDDIRNHASINLRMLAAHQSGLPAYPDNMGDDLDAEVFEYSPGTNYTKAKLATDIAAGNSDPVFVPGSNSLYSNFGYGMLSICLQNRFSYADDDELLDAKVFTPLGMTKTSTNAEPFMTDNASDLAQGYMSDGDAVPYPDMGILAGAGEFISSVNDMLIFIKELADRSSSYSVEMAVDISGPHAAIGYGHAIGTTGDGEDLRTKGGNTASFSSAIAWRENPNIGVVVLTNKGDMPGLVQLAEDMLDDAVARLP